MRLQPNHNDTKEERKKKQYANYNSNVLILWGSKKIDIIHDDAHSLHIVKMKMTT